MLKSAKWAAAVADMDTDEKERCLMAIRASLKDDNRRNEANIRRDANNPTDDDYNPMDAEERRQDDNDQAEDRTSTPIRERRAARRTLNKQSPLKIDFEEH